MKYLRATHRFVTVIVVVFTLYLAFTGIMIQLIDLRSILTHAPASDPNVIAMRESSDGPGNYEVRAVSDSTAAALPVGADLDAMLSLTMRSARLTVGDIPLRWVELRMENGRPAGVIESAGRLAVFDATTGQIIRSGPSRRTDPESPDSQRNTWKHLHRMTTFGNYALFINVIVGVGLAVMIVTGLLIYFKMLKSRSRSGISSPFWSGGGRWRSWHRRISIVAALFLVVVSLSGLWLAYESLYFGFYIGSNKQKADNQAFLTVQAQRTGGYQAARIDPMSSEAQPGRLASMKQDIGLIDAEMVRIKAISDASVKKNLELRSTGTDSLTDQGKIMSLHQEEANAIMAVLTREEKLKFQAWRDAQLLGMPVPQGGQRRDGAPQAGHQSAGNTQGQGLVQGLSGNNPEHHGPGAPDGADGKAGGGTIFIDDASSPIRDADLPSMLQVTLNAEHSDLPNTPIKVVRLRYYAGMPQGVIVTGGRNTNQEVFNATTGRAVSETERGYPPVAFPFGWQAHQTAKDVHRGGIIGLPGRFMDLFAGLSLFYLSVSGLAIYLDLWRRRRKSGKRKLLWV